MDYLQYFRRGPIKQVKRLLCLYSVRHSSRIRFFQNPKKRAFLRFFEVTCQKNIKNVFQVSESWLCWLFSIFIRLLQNIYGLSFRIEDNKTDWGWSSFRPETLSLYMPCTIHVTTVTFFNVFLRFFQNPKKRDFLRFFALLHTFSRTMVWEVVMNGRRHGAFHPPGPRRLE